MRYFLDVDIKDFDVLAKWCKENKIDLVVVGPEDPLAKGICDTLTDKGKAANQKCCLATILSIRLTEIQIFDRMFLHTKGMNSLILYNRQ